MNQLKSNASSFINIDFIQNLQYNQTKCKIYSNYTELDYLYNITDDDKYTNITYNINITFYHCINNTFENDYNKSIYYDLDNITLNEKIWYIFNETNNCSVILNDLENDTYYNETLEMMECFMNNYYNYNYSFIYFYNFNDTIEKNLSNFIEEINNTIKKNNFDENFLYNFLESQNYSLENYSEIDLSDISYDFEDIESMIHYINLMEKNEYRNYLNNCLINSFNKSYSDFVNNFILEELLDDIIISINKRLEIHLDYMTQKIKDEYIYYLLILDKTNELGNSSKLAIINLYEIIMRKLNETIFYLFQDDISFYLNLFYRENKKILRNEFLNYYFRNINQYGIIIFKIKDYEDEFILDSKFNKTLDKMSDYFMKNIIIEKIKDKINNSILSKIQNLYNIIDNYKINIKTILDNKVTRPLPPDMTHLNEIIIYYTILVNNQNNRYYLNISDKPFNILYEFIHNNLEPPLVLIQEQYNSIEERLLKELFNIIDNFPNYYLVVKDLLDLEGMNENITPYINCVNSTLLNYSEILDYDIKTYINKLMHYSYINGLYYQDSPCEDSYCFNESEILESDIDLNNLTIFNNSRRRLEPNDDLYILNKLFNMPKLDKNKINKLRNKKIRNLGEYDSFNSSLGSITENDINSCILDMQSILFEFNESFLDKEFLDIVRFSKSYFDKINNTYLFRLKRSIDMVGIRFQTIFTEDSYNTFEKRLYAQYNDILKYIHNYSDIIDNTKNEFIDILNSSSNLMETIFNISYMKINTYYTTIYDLIQDKLKYIKKEDEDIYDNMIRLLSKKIEEYEEEEDDDDNEHGIPEPGKIKIVRNKEGEIESVKINKVDESKYWNDLIKGPKNDIISTIIRKESVLDSVKKQFLSNFNKKKNELSWDNIKQNIKGFFKTFEIEIDSSAGLNCNKKSCNLMLKFCFKLFELKLKKFIFPITLLPYIDCAISIIPSVNSEICAGLGPKTNSEKEEENSFDIEISGSTSVSVTVDFGVYFPSYNSPIRLSLNIGLVGILGSAEVGVVLSLNFKDTFSIDLYYEFKAFEFSFYVMFQYTFALKFGTFEINFSFGFDIFRKLFGGFKYAHHNKREYKYKKSKMVEHIRTTTNNGGKWSKKKLIM